MHGQLMKHLIVAAGALVIGLLAAGSSLQLLLLFVACPLLMVFMMRGMGGPGGHGRQGADHAEAGRAHDNAAARR